MSMFLLPEMKQRTRFIIGLVLMIVGIVAQEYFARKALMQQEALTLVGNKNNNVDKEIIKLKTEIRERSDELMEELGKQFDSLKKTIEQREHHVSNDANLSNDTNLTDEESISPD